MKKIKIKKRVFLIVILLILLVVTRGFTYARYASSAVFNYYLSSNGFYFESEDLTSDNKNIVDTMWDGEKVEFSITNTSEGDVSSEFDIEYEVTCEVLEDDNKKCLINDTEGSYNSVLSANFACSDGSSKSQGDCENDGYTWEAKRSISNLNFTVVGVDGSEVLGAKIKITATSTKPYSKTLSATYNLIKDSEALGSLSMQYTKKSLKGNLVVTNSYNEDKCVLVTWDASKLAFDNNVNDFVATKVDNDNNINGAYFTVSKMNSELLEFYEMGNGSYGETDFSLVESNLCE